MSDSFEMDLTADPRGQVLLKIQDMTGTITDSLNRYENSNTPVLEGFTSFDTGRNSTRVYLIMARADRILLYSVEVPSVPRNLMFSRAEADLSGYTKSTFTCLRIIVDNPDDLSYLLAQEDDSELQKMKPVVPIFGETGEDFISNNAMWLANPTIN